MKKRIMAIAALALLAVCGLVWAVGDVIPFENGGADLGQAARQWRTIRAQTVIAQSNLTTQGNLDISGTLTTTGDVTHVSTTAGDEFLWDASAGGVVIDTVVGSNAVSILVGNIDVAAGDVDLGSTTSGDELLWDASAGSLILDTVSGSNAIDVLVGDVNFADDLSVQTDVDVGGTFAVTGAATFVADITANGDIIGDGSTLITNMSIIYADAVARDDGFSGVTTNISFALTSRFWWANGDMTNVTYP